MTQTVDRMSCDAYPFSNIQSGICGDTHGGATVRSGTPALTPFSGARSYQNPEHVVNFDDGCDLAAQQGCPEGPDQPDPRSRGFSTRRREETQMKRYL